MQRHAAQLLHRVFSKLLIAKCWSFVRKPWGSSVHACAEVLRALPGPSEHTIVPFTIASDPTNTQLPATTADASGIAAWQAIWHEATATAAHSGSQRVSGAGAGAQEPQASESQQGEWQGAAPSNGEAQERAAAEAAAAAAAAAEQTRLDEDLALYDALHEATGVPEEVIAQLQVRALLLAMFCWCGCGDALEPVLCGGSIAYAAARGAAVHAAPSVCLVLRCPAVGRVRPAACVRVDRHFVARASCCQC